MLVLNLLFKDKTIIIVDSLVEAKHKAIKAMTMTDLSSADETVRVGRKHQKELMHSPTSSTNSCPLFLGKKMHDILCLIFKYQLI